MGNIAPECFPAKTGPIRAVLSDTFVQQRNLARGRVRTQMRRVEAITVRVRILVAPTVRNRSSRGATPDPEPGGQSHIPSHQEWLATYLNALNALTILNGLHFMLNLCLNLCST